MSTDTTYKFPVYGTQGGGLVREHRGDDGSTFYTFVEAPTDCPGLEVGDKMPEMWGIVPANQAAHDDAFEKEFGDPFA